MDALQVQLTVADLKEIKDGFAKIRVQGARFGNELMSWG